MYRLPQSREDLIAYHQYFASQAAPSSVEEAIQTAKEQLLAGARRACIPAAYSVFERLYILSRKRFLLNPEPARHIVLRKGERKIRR